jgi:hypothetical protein
MPLLPWIVFAPFKNVVSIECDAKQIRRDKAELPGVHANDANENAVRAGDDPAFPPLSAHQDGRGDCQNAGDIVQTEHVECLSNIK